MMSERIKTVLIALAASAFAFCIVVVSIGAALFGFGLLGFGISMGLLLFVLAIIGLVFAGFFTLRVLVPLTRLAIRPEK